MLNYLAFFGTGPCNDTDLRNASIGRIITVIIAVLLLILLFSKLIIPGSFLKRTLGIVISLVVILMTMAIFYATYVMTACSPR